MATEVSEIPTIALAALPKAEERRLAIIDGAGEIVVIGPTLPALTLEQAESVFVAAKETQSALKRFIEFVEGGIVAGWERKKQVEGILGGRRYKIERKPGTYVYRDVELFAALKPFVGKVLTEEERIEALGWSYEPTRVIPATVVPEIVSYAPSTQQLDAIAKRSVDVRAVIDAHRSRELGDPRLVEVKK